MSMDPWTFSIGALAGILVGASIAWIAAQLRSAQRSAEAARAAAALEAQLGERLLQAGRLEEEIAQRGRRIESLQGEISDLKAKLEGLSVQFAGEKKSAGEKIAFLEDAERRIREAFQSMSSEALRNNNQSFLDLARTALEKFQEGAKGDLEKREQAIAELVKPVKESLDKFDVRIQDIEKARTGAYEGISQQVRSLLETQAQLRTETANLVKALRAPVVRGRWGEIQLRRVVELAGMVNHCDFEEQESVATEEGRLRPDMIVRLPGEKKIVVDAKAPLAAYLESLEAPDEGTRLGKLKDHARQVRTHLQNLGRKSYWDQFQPAPEFVILFLPGEAFFSAALEQDPGLIEAGVERGVFLATPTTLITLLRAVAFGWRQESVARNAQEICDLGRELYTRIAGMAEHWTKLGKSLDSAVESFNKAVGTLESRVLVSARRFKELHAAPERTEIEEVQPLDHQARKLQSPAMLPPPGGGEGPVDPGSKE